MRTYKEIAELSIEKAAVIKKKKKKRMMALGIAGGVISCLMIAVAVTISVLYYQYKQLYGYVPEIKGYEPEGEGLVLAGDVGELYNYFEYNLSVKIYEPVPTFGEWLLEEYRELVYKPTILSKGEYGSLDFIYKEEMGYSQTNIQVEGIDEADIVKCDGEFIYYLSGGVVYIVKADAGDLETVGTIDAPKLDANKVTISNMYLYENKLILIGERHYNIYYKSKKGERDAVFVGFCDISDKNNPVLTKTLCVSGTEMGTRLHGDKLYLVTNDYLGHVENCLSRNDPATFMPRYYEDDVEYCFEANEIYYESDGAYFAYINTAIIDLGNEEMIDRLSILGSWNCELYQSYENIYLSSVIEGGTKIYRISTGDGLALEAETFVPGQIINNFALDEYEGHLRTVVYEYSKTCFYVFDMGLNVVSKIDDIGVSEDLKSVRFDGDIAYFVTYRDIDPLFCVDVSDPADPMILSELKIPGFSEYLHVYGDGLLFGLGMTEDWNVKLVMFDVTDKTDVKVNATRILEEHYDGWNYNDYHAILVDGEKGIIGFMAENTYYVCTYDGDFKVLEKLNVPLNQSGYAENIRGLYIDDHFYLCCVGSIRSYEMSGFNLTDSVILK